MSKIAGEMSNEKLKEANSHFAFGKNWASYSDLIGDREISEAVAALSKLIPGQELSNRTFLDIGCGSGLHALAAARLGVASLLATDIDVDSVSTTRAVLTKHSASVPWTAEKISLFDLDPAKAGTFDIVYSWGVLHHTGAMNEAIAKAAAMVKPGGLFAFALYRSTRLDAFWKMEKSWYAHASAPMQKLARAIYISAFSMGLLLTGRSIWSHIANYRSSRGMDWFHDVHDWLGGHPYETILSPQVEQHMGRLGFERVREFSRPMSLGLLGSGCDEYVYRKQHDRS